VLFKGEFSEGDAAGGAALKQRRVTRWMLWFAIVSGLATVGAFVYSLKDVAADSRREVLQGTGIAVVVLSIGGFLIHKTVRFFEEQDKVNLAARQDEEDDHE
jgi:hypothetical protein